MGGNGGGIAAALLPLLQLFQNGIRQGFRGGFGKAAGMVVGACTRAHGGDPRAVQHGVQPVL